MRKFPHFLGEISSFFSKSYLRCEQRAIYCIVSAAVSTASPPRRMGPRRCAAQVVYPCMIFNFNE